MKYIITALLSAALIWLVPTGTPVKNSTQSAKAQTVQAKLTEKQPQTKVQDKALTEPQPVVEPVAKVVTPEPKQVPQGCAAYVPLLQKYDWNVSTMAAVMQAESNCNPNAASPPNYDGLRDYGLMQLHGQEIYDPATNVAHAYAIWQRQGYHAWSTYSSGAYLRYL